MKNIAILSVKTLSEATYPLEEVACSFTSAAGDPLKKKVEIYKRPSAAAVLLYDPENRTVLLTEQVRIPAFLNGGEETLTEACAGLIDPEEDPEDTIVREVKEELGLSVSEVKKLFELYSSPGGNTELIHYFLAKYSARQKHPEAGGNTGEGEDIVPVELSYEQALKELNNGGTRDAKTFILLQYAALNGIFE